MTQRRKSVNKRMAVMGSALASSDAIDNSNDDDVDFTGSNSNVKETMYYGGTHDRFEAFMT